MVFATLGAIIDEYFIICRMLRNMYKWSFLDVDYLPWRTIIRLYNETEEDIEMRNQEVE